MDEQLFRFGDLRGILRRRARVMAIAAAAVLLPAIFLTAILPNRYVAYTTMLVEPQAISTKLVETGKEEGDLTNRLHLMTMQILSRARLSKIIDDLGLYEDLEGKFTREQIIERMRGQIWVEPVLPELQAAATGRRNEPVEINTFRLFFRHEKPRTAADVVNRLSSDFIDEHIRDRVQVAGDTAEFIENELGRLAQRLREVEAQIAQIKAENAGSLPDDRANNETRLLRSLDALRAAQRELAEAEGDAAFYRQQAVVLRSSEGRRGDVVGKAVSPALRLQELEIMLGELRARGFTDKHPDVVSTTAEMEQLRSRVESDDPQEGSTSVAEQEARGLAERAAAKAEMERQEIERIQGEIDAIQESLARTPRVAEQLDALVREYASLSESFQSYSNKRVEATVAANMERRQKGEQFRVLESAVPPPEPASPNRRLLLALAFVFALALAAGIAVLQEASDTSVHDPRSLQERLRIPVLASVPAILLESDRMERRRRWLREATAAGVVTATVLLASLVGYVYVNAPGLFRRDEQVAPAAAPPAPAAAPARGASPPADGGAAAPSGG